MADVVFRYEFSSPYSYLSAHRVEARFPGGVRWQPILFGGLIRAIGKTPWSLQPGDEREARMRDCEARAAELGLPLTWPPDWPLGTYSVLAARVALAAEESGRQPHYAREAFRLGLGLGHDLRDPEVVGAAVRAAGLDAAALLERAEHPDVKARLQDATDEAARIGITGVPTFTLPGGEHFWGDDRLGDAAAAHG